MSEFANDTAVEMTLKSTIDGDFLEEIRSGKEVQVDFGFVKLSADGDKRQMKLRASTKNAVKGVAILPTAWDLTRYRKNPIILWMHNMWQDLPPIAKALWTKPDEEGLLQLVEFAKHQFAEEIYQLYVEDFLRAWSVGWKPFGYIEKGADDFKDTVKKWRIQGDPQIIVTKAVLYEVSAVTVPADEDALVKRSFSESTADILRRYVPNINTQSDIDKIVAEPPEERIDPGEPWRADPEDMMQFTVEQGAEILMILREMKEEIVALRREIDTKTQKSEQPKPVEMSADQIRQVAGDVMRGEINRMKGKIA